MNRAQIADRIVKRAWAPFASIPIGSRRRCAICSRVVGRFLPYERGWRGAPPLMAALDWIGSDLDHFECPRCGAHDRERHLFLFMTRAGMFEKLRGQSVVHFAPERHLSRIISAGAPARYVKCDLFPTSSEIERQDLLQMTFETGSVDLFIANHVLEHVDDDTIALSEIRRVLKVGGMAILQTPFSAKLEHTWADPGIADLHARREAYGQEDHVRLYGQDIVERVVSAGFSSRVRSHNELLPDVDADIAGVNVREPFLLFERT